MVFIGAGAVFSLWEGVVAVATVRDDSRKLTMFGKVWIEPMMKQVGGRTYRCYIRSCSVSPIRI
jgi:Tfp pilus assembly protein PilZ